LPQVQLNYKLWWLSSPYRTVDIFLTAFWTLLDRLYVPEGERIGYVIDGAGNTMFDAEFPEHRMNAGLFPSKRFPRAFHLNKVWYP
jgi:hypothetical protein